MDKIPTVLNDEDLTYPFVDLPNESRVSTFAALRPARYLTLDNVDTHQVPYDDYPNPGVAAFEALLTQTLYVPGDEFANPNHLLSDARYEPKDLLLPDMAHRYYNHVHVCFPTPSDVKVYVFGNGDPECTDRVGFVFVRASDKWNDRWKGFMTQHRPTHATSWFRLVEAEKVEPYNQNLEWRNQPTVLHDYVSDRNYYPAPIRSLSEARDLIKPRLWDGLMFEDDPKFYRVYFDNNYGEVPLGHMPLGAGRVYIEQNSGHGLVVYYYDLETGVTKPILQKINDSDEWRGLSSKWAPRSGINVIHRNGAKAGSLVLRITNPIRFMFEGIYINPLAINEEDGKTKPEMRTIRILS